MRRIKSLIKKLIKSYVYTPLVLLLDSACLLFFSLRRAEQKQGAIFFLHGLGDLIISANSINALSAYIKSQGLRSFLFVEPNLVDFCRDFIKVDEVRPISRRRFVRSLSYRLNVAASICQRFALSIQPHYNRQIIVEDSLIRLSSYGKRIGNNGAGLYIGRLERLIGDMFYTKLVTLSPQPMHDLTRNQEFIGKLGLDIKTGPFRFADASLKPLSPNIAAASLLSTPYMLLAPFSSHPMKSWPLERFMQSASEISSKFGLTIVVIGAGYDDLISWPAAAGLELPMTNLCGETSIDDLLALIRQARFVLGNDSGVFHLSVALDTPVVSVGGGGMPVRFFPYPNSTSHYSRSLDHPMPCFGCGWNCIYPMRKGSTAKCLLEVKVSEVVKAAVDILSQKS